MRAVIQRVREASVTVESDVVGQIDHGLLVLLGIGHDDSSTEVDWMAKKIVKMRIFDDEEGKMNRSVLDVGGAILAVSQFTLYGNAKKGNRPSFIDAARPAIANPLYEKFCEALSAAGVTVAQGVFGAEMDVRLLNDGPITIWLSSEE